MSNATRRRAVDALERAVGRMRQALTEWQRLTAIVYQPDQALRAAWGNPDARKREAQLRRAEKTLDARRAAVRVALAAIAQTREENK